MTRGAKPYLVPETGINLSPWLVQSGADWEPLSDALEGWDTGTDLVIRRSVHCDLAIVRAACGFRDDAVLRVSVSWLSSTTTMSEVAGSQDIPPTGRLEFEAVLPGERVGGVLDIRTTVNLAHQWKAPAGVAALAASILVEHSWRVALEGTGSLFPVSVIDFSHTMFDPDASWHLSTSIDLEAPFMGRFLLSINGRDNELVEAVSEKSRSPRQVGLVDGLRHELAQLMLRLAQDVNAADPLDGQEWPPDSVGDILSRVFESSDLVPPTVIADPSEDSMRRTLLEGSTRRSGHGRAFR